MYDGTNKCREFNTNDVSCRDDLVKIGTALACRTRIDLLTLVNVSPKTITELSHLLYISTSAVLFHVHLLEEAALVKTEYMTKRNKEVRMIVSNIRSTLIDFAPKLSSSSSRVEELRFEMPIGAYTEFKAVDRRGILLDGYKFLVEPYSTKRFDALVIWCDCGYAEYQFPCHFFKSKKVRELNFTMEICSETAQYRLDFESDITFSANGKEIAMYTCPSDFGGRRGKLNPDWWTDDFTQYGQLIKICITHSGTYLNGELCSNITLNDLDLEEREGFIFRIENKRTAKHVGGFNLFSKRFGDYEQDIVMTAVCESEAKQEFPAQTDIRVI